MKRYLLPALFVLSFVVLPAAALAAGVGDSTGNTGNSSGNIGGAPVTQGGLSYDIKNPLGVESFCGLVKNLLRAAIQIGIPVAVLFIVYAGFKFVLARGKPEALAEARKNFLWTIIGIAIFLGAWLLATVIANTVNELGGSQSLISCR